VAPIFISSATEDAMANIAIRFINLLGDTRKDVIVDPQDGKGSDYMRKFGKHMRLSYCGAPWPNYLLEVKRVDGFKAHAAKFGLAVEWQAREAGL
jgi:hypothetical protein